MVKDHSYREKTGGCHFIGYYFPVAARDLLYALSQRWVNTYHVLYYTNSGALAGTGTSSKGPA